MRDKQYWDRNAENWTKLSRDGYDTYRDAFNTPAFLETIPDISGARGLDIGCGEGYNTRMLSKLGAEMTAVDQSDTFIKYAKEFEETTEMHGIDYRAASALELPFPDNSFDFVTSFMAVMDIPDLDRQFSEVVRVLKPGGFYQFSITHPCFLGPCRKNVLGEYGKIVAVEIADYFKTGEHLIEWKYSSLPPEKRDEIQPFKYVFYHRNISDYVNALYRAGLCIEMMNEPMPDDNAVRAFPEIADARVIAYFLHIRARKSL